MAGQHPYSLRGVQVNPLARMLPLQREQTQVYRLGEKNPPSELGGYSPAWLVIPLIMTSRQTVQQRVDLPRNFTLLALTTSASASTSGGFRAQMYDFGKKRRLADRGVQQALMAGSAGGQVFLRDPYPFDNPGPQQLLIVVQNLESTNNNLMLSLYGVCLRFNQNVPAAGGAK